jgi:SOS-response transcriptional repressor LexA
MVVVLDQGEAVVKRICREGTSYVLRSSNETYPPIPLSPGAEHLGGQLVRGEVIGRVLWHTAAGRPAR